MNSEAIQSWMTTHGFSILGILAGAFLVRHFGLLPLERFIRRLVKEERFKSKVEYKQRQDTLVDIARGVFAVVVWITAGAMIIAELNINIQPILAGAGIIGVAISFGAKDMIANILAGFFIITENQYRVGDWLKINDEVEGKVEYISLRMTVLRDNDGVAHHIPNGTIQVASNYSKEFARVHMNIAVGYKEDLKKAIQVIDQVGEDLAKDKEYEHSIISPPAFARIDKFGDWAIYLKVMGDVRPGTRLDVASEYSQRLLVAFKKVGIEMPLPQIVTHRS